MFPLLPWKLVILQCHYSFYWQTLPDKSTIISSGFVSKKRCLVMNRQCWIHLWERINFIKWNSDRATKYECKSRKYGVTKAELQNLYCTAWVCTFKDRPTATCTVHINKIYHRWWNSRATTLGLMGLAWLAWMPPWAALGINNDVAQCPEEGGRTGRFLAHICVKTAV